MGARASRLVYGRLLLVAVVTLATTGYALAGAFGHFTVVVGSRLSVADPSSLAVAGGTLFLGASTGLLTMSTRAAAAETRDEARANRAGAKASLDIKFDKDLPALWSTDVGFVRVMVVSQGPATAQHVVVTLETIEPQNPMLDARYQVPDGPLSKGSHVLPSTLQWKRHDKRRNLEVAACPEYRVFAGNQRQRPTPTGSSVCSNSGP